MNDAIFRLSSTAFDSESPIPAKFTCEGENVSPPLKWGDVPDGTRSLVLIVDDPDAPEGTFTHWVLFDIPASAEALSEGVSDVGIAGLNDFKHAGYGGPCPPHGGLVHRYFFALTAVDIESLGLREGASRMEVESVLSGHVVDSAQLVGTYLREKK